MKTRTLIFAAFVIFVLLAFTLALAAYKPPSDKSALGEYTSAPSDIDTRKFDNIITFSIYPNGTITRFTDREAGVVCWWRRGDSLFCIPVDQTKLMP